MVENAEMFGLSQLHQIRGRLGRTDQGKPTAAGAAAENSDGNVAAPQPPLPPSPEKKPTSHCILLYGPNLSHEASERLKAVRTTRDGFLLAERDLALRGPGQVLGIRQKGYLDGR